MPQSKLDNYTKPFLYAFGRFILNKKYMTGHSVKYDLKFKFKTQDSVGRTIFKKGLYEEVLTNHLLNHLELNEGDIVFDVGANIGWYSNLFAKYYTGLEIHSFEPDPENYDLLKHNLKQNNAQGVHPNNVGLGEKTEVIKLYLYKKSNQGRHSMLKINEGPTIDVDITSFDEYVQKANVDVSKIKFLKIDIEGFEYSAFSGGKEFLKHVPIIMAEFSPGLMRKGGVEPDDLLKLLRSYNFIPYAVESTGLVAMDDDMLLSRDTNINLIWNKESIGSINRSLSPK